MAKNFHEIRDPIHVFVRMTSDERKVLDSRPFQRLRHIHQLALTYLVYPGATHQRFEHSLGVMELAGRVFDVVTEPENVTDETRRELPDIVDNRKREYWRCVLRMAALCHDIGHLPFSHTAEKELLPERVTHETLTAMFIRSNEMHSIWRNMKLDPEDVVKLALGPKEAQDMEFSIWETILAEIIVGDAFGVDRMDYLLRDSHHTGVAYGKFDHYRLIDTLRILPIPPSGEDNADEEFALGVEEGGIQSSEALMLARYFMYSQVYFHPVRRVYDIHLKDFLKDWLPAGDYPMVIEDHLRMTDTEVITAMREAERDPEKPGHVHARKIIRREHFKRIYSHNPEDSKINPEAGKAVFEALGAEFGAGGFRHDRYHQKGGAPDFPVHLNDGRVASSLTVSEVITRLPVVNVDYVFADREIAKKAQAWLEKNRIDIIQPRKEGDNNG